MSMFHTQSRIGSEHLDFLQSALNSPSQGMPGSQRSLYSKPLCAKMMYVTRNSAEEVRKKNNGKKVTLKEEVKDMDLFSRIKDMFMPSQNDKEKKSNTFKTLLILSLILGGGGMLIYTLNKRGVFNKMMKKKKDDEEEDKEVVENGKVTVIENGGKKHVKGHYIAPVSKNYTQITKKAAHTSYAPKPAYGHKKKVTYKDTHIPSYVKSSSPQYSQHYGDEQVGYMASSKKYHQSEYYDDDDAEMDMHSYSRYGESPNMEEKYHMD